MTFDQWLFTCVFIVFIVFFFCALSSLTVGLHKSMMKNRDFLVLKGNYKSFVIEFEKIDWYQVIYFHGSLFNYESNSEIHASIFRFNGVGMLITNPFTYARICAYVNKQKRINKYPYKMLHEI